MEENRVSDFKLLLIKYSNVGRLHIVSGIFNGKLLKISLQSNVFNFSSTFFCITFLGLSKLYIYIFPCWSIVALALCASNESLVELRIYSSGASCPEFGILIYKLYPGYY